MTVYRNRYGGECTEWNDLADRNLPERVVEIQNPSGGGGSDIFGLYRNTEVSRNRKLLFTILAGIIITVLGGVLSRLIISIYF